MPKRIGKKERTTMTKSFMDLIKAGQVASVVESLKAIFLRPSSLVKRWMAYLEKHTDRMQYADYQEKGLMRAAE